jgi:hypothetical protein
LLMLGKGSVMLGWRTVALLKKEPVAFETNVPLMMKVTEAFNGKLMT